MTGFARGMEKPGRFVVVVLLLLVLLGVLLAGLIRSGSQGKRELRVACAAAFRKPMEEIARRFEEETGTSVVLSFGGSGALAAQVQVAGGDLFFPADDRFFDALEQRKMLNDRVPMVRMQPGLVVAKGNPKEIQSLRDLGKDGVRVVLANESAAIGRVSWGLFREGGLSSKVKRNLVVTKPTVTEIVEDVALGAADVTIAWRSVVRNDTRVEWIPNLEEFDHDYPASFGILESAFSQEEAEAFVEYCLDPQKGGAVFDEMGFLTGAR